MKGEGVAAGAAAPPTVGRDPGGRGEANILRWLAGREFNERLAGLGVATRVKLGERKCDVLDEIKAELAKENSLI